MPRPQSLISAALLLSIGGGGCGGGSSQVVQPAPVASLQTPAPRAGSEPGARTADADARPSSGGPEPGRDQAASSRPGPPPRREPAVPPELSPVAGTLDRELVREAARRQRRALARCFAEAARRHPDAGTPQLEVTWPARGPARVSVSGDGADQELERCVTRAVEQLPQPVR